MLRFITLSTIATLSLTACSVWQNASRKYMEKQSYDYAGLKLHEENFVGCGRPADVSQWAPGAHDDRALVYVREFKGRFELRVEPAIDGAMACDYAFASAEDRAAATEAAIQNTLDQFDAP